MGSSGKASWAHHLGILELLLVTRRLCEVRVPTEAPDTRVGVDRSYSYLGKGSATSRFHVCAAPPALAKPTS